MNIHAGGRLSIGMVAPVWVPVPPTGYGGTEWIVHWLAEGLAARGHEVVLVGSGAATFGGKFVSTYERPPYRRMGEMLPELIHAAEAYKAVAGCDVVHDHTLGGILFGNAQGSIVVHTVHGQPHVELCRYYADLDGVALVAISAAQRREAPQLRWAATIPNAIDVTAFPYEADKDDYLAFLARITPDKGVVEAIRLARELGRPLRIAAKLNEPLELEYFRTHVEPLLSADIEYLGELSTSDKKPFLAHAKALAFPIQWDEPFGLAMVEALACGTPVLATRRGSVPEIVDDGVTGVVGRDVDELVRRCLTDLDSIHPADCRAAAETRFDLPRLIDNHETLYRALLRA